MGPPTVAPDGSVYVELEVQQFTYTESAPPSCQVIPAAYSDDLSLLRVVPDGGTQMQTLASYGLADVVSLPGGVDFPIHAAGDIIPDGGGGVLASWANYPGTSEFPPLTIADIGPQGNTQVTLSNFQEPGYPGYPVDNDLVLGDNNTAFATDGFTVVAFDATTLQQKWSYASTGGFLSFVAATSGGGVTINDNQQGMIQLDSSGNASAPVASLQGAVPYEMLTPSSPTLGQGLGLWSTTGMTSPASLTFLASAAIQSADSGFAKPAGAGQKQRSAVAIPRSISYALGPEIAMNGQLAVCGAYVLPQTVVTHYYGYYYCATAIVRDKNQQPLIGQQLLVWETIQVAAEFPPNQNIQTSQGQGRPVDLAGIFPDLISALTTSPLGLPSGYVLKTKQFFTVTNKNKSYNNLLILCHDDERTGGTFADVTNTPNASCQ